MPSEWVVRVVQFNRGGPINDHRDIAGMWLEQLRHMNIIHWITRDEQMPDPVRPGEFVYKQVFDIYAPRHVAKVHSQRWAEREAARMQSFTINAVAAPAWKAGDKVPS